MEKPSWPAGDLLEGFLEWMGTREGLESMDALDCVFNALDGATVEAFERKIICPDGQPLSIEQSVERIHKHSGLDRQAILSRLIGWLRMEYEPQGLNIIKIRCNGLKSKSMPGLRNMMAPFQRYPIFRIKTGQELGTLKDLMNISTYLQMVVMGLLLIFAVVMDHFRLSLKGRHR